MAARDVVVVDPLADEVPAEWDAFFARAGLISLWHSELLTTVARVAQAPTLMALVLDGGEAVAAFHARFVGLPADPRRPVRPGARPVFGLVEARLHPFGSIAGHRFAPGLTPRDRAAAVTAFESAVRRRLGLRVAGIAHRQVGGDELAAFTRGARLVGRVQPDMAIERRWDDVDGWLKTLRPKRRQKIRGLARAVDGDTTMRVSVENEVDAGEAAPLADAVRRRHRPRWWVTPAIPVEYVRRLARFEDVSFITYRDAGGRLLAYTAMHDTGDELMSTIWGYRPVDDGGRLDLYFDLYYRMVSLLLRLGRSRLVVGKGMAELKVRYGAEPRERFVVVGR